MNSRTPSGPTNSALAAHVLAAVRRPHRRGALHVVGADRLEVSSRDRLRLGFPPGSARGVAAASRTLAATSWTFVAASLALLLLSHLASSFGRRRREIP